MGMRIDRFTKNIAINHQDMKDHRSRISEAKAAAKAVAKTHRDNIEQEESIKLENKEKKHVVVNRSQQTETSVKARKKIVFRTIRSENSNKLLSSYE